MSCVSDIRKCLFVGSWEVINHKSAVNVSLCPFIPFLTVIRFHTNTHLHTDREKRTGQSRVKRFILLAVKFFVFINDNILDALYIF